VSRLPQTFHFFSFLLLFSFFTQFRAPVTEPGSGAAYPLTPSNRPCPWPDAAFGS